MAPANPATPRQPPAFDVAPARFVIHTVGPVWEGGSYGEADTLASCYRRSLEVADSLDVRSIALPAIAYDKETYEALSD